MDLFKEFGNWANYDEEYKDCTWPDGDQRLLNCKLKNCKYDSQPIYGQFEGGLGYWPYMTEAKGVKWMVPGSVSGYYNKYGSTFQTTFHQLCTNMGGSIQISNNILLAPDGYSFEPNADGKVDGMLGYMLQNTPIGKMHPDDNRNFWTVVADTENFSGPLMYASPYFWEHPNSWRPEIRTWSDPDVKIGGATEGTEGNVGTVAVEMDGYYYFRMQDTEMHLDDNGDSTTITTGHVKYLRDWAWEVLEPVLDGTNSNTSPADVRAASQNARTKPDCIIRGQCDECWGEYLVSGQYGSGEDPFGYTVGGWGIGDDRVGGNPKESNDEWCHSKMPVDTSSPFLTCSNRVCRLTPYYRIPSDKSSDRGELIAEIDLPIDIKTALDAHAEKLWEPVSRANHGEYLDFPGDDQMACFDKPGPADPTLYCRRTTDERWLAYRWYRFVDQPEMNQVIGSLPEDEQEETKCYMQARIERLHEMQAKEQSPRWFDAPGALPIGKVKIDQGFIVTPPPGLEIGYVPVSIYTKLRHKPDDCEVVEGEYSSEPNPLPENYFVEPIWWRIDHSRDPQQCYPTNFSGDTYDVPGTLYLSKRDGSGDKYPYTIPKREEVGNFVPIDYDSDQCPRDGFGGLNPTPAPTPVPTPPTGFACFSESSTVEVRDKGIVSMKELQIGDQVLVSADTYEPIYSFGHYHKTIETQFLKILTTSSMSPLEITKDHMLFVNGRPVPASLVKFGDQLSLPDPGTTVTVEGIEAVSRKGAYAPFTPSGTIAVNGILASTFVAFQESEYLSIGGLRTPISFQWVAHTFETPHRTFCSFASTWCERELYSSTGISLWVYLPLHITEFAFAYGKPLAASLLLIRLVFRLRDSSKM